MRRKPCPEHLAEFKKTLSEQNVWFGPGLQGFLDAAGTSPVHDDLYTGDMSRERLKEIAKDTVRYAPRDVMWAILWWGGMGRNNAYTMVEKNAAGAIADVVQDLRKGLGRKAAYQAFLDLQKCSIGLGPAFFTKLIFFAGKDHDGYIMDQWVARSINLLFGEVVIMDGVNGTVVSKNNTSGHYDEFCNCIEALRDDKLRTGEDVEMALFSPSIAGNVGTWRAYLKEQAKAEQKKPQE